MMRKTLFLILKLYFKYFNFVVYSMKWTTAIIGTRNCIIINTSNKVNKITQKVKFERSYLSVIGLSQRMTSVGQGYKSKCLKYVFSFCQQNNLYGFFYYKVFMLYKFFFKNMLLHFGFCFKMLNNFPLFQFTVNVK